MRDHPALEESAVLTHLQRVRDRGATLVRHSETFGAVSRQSNTLERAARQSRLFGLACRTRQFVEGAWVYRWLTTDPDPDVVVIDLRETRTVGPLLALGQRVGDRVRPVVVSSRLVARCRRSSRPVHTSRTDCDEQTAPRGESTGRERD